MPVENDERVLGSLPDPTKPPKLNTPGGGTSDGILSYLSLPDLDALNLSANLENDDEHTDPAPA